MYTVYAVAGDTGAEYHAFIELSCAADTSHTFSTPDSVEPAVLFVNITFFWYYYYIRIIYVIRTSN